MTQLLERMYVPVYVNDITKDFDMVEGIFAKDFAGIALHRHFCTDAVNGALGHELKYNGKPVLSSVIRVGFRSVNDAKVPLQVSTLSLLRSRQMRFWLQERVL